MNLIINEASLPFSTKEKCISELKTLFKLIHLADYEGIGFNHNDDPLGNWNSLHYADDFVFSEWINKLDNDSSKLVKNVLSKVSCPIVILEDKLRDSLDELMFSLSCSRDIEVSSLGLAATIGSCALSFPSQEYWLQNPIKIIKNWDDNNIWKEDLIDVPNICSLEHLENYIIKIKNVRQSNKDYLTSLEIKENQDFPNLIFCKNVLKNFSSSAISANDFFKINYVLKKLNQAILLSNNLEELKLGLDLSISGESKTTMERPKYARQREFEHPDLGNIMFEQHVKNFESGKRMHIFVDFTSKKVAIGYFGSHLPTVKHP
ncbi:hypothetical protein [uncultured Psychromonas sp.]|uniref:hypothetical protein n=1 Tax=uncultured Psychromonas sp. TaxID=173974 RepID=UPI0026159505|nr:hypothetical protein [uncultured Psychromonas sp.]